MPDPLRRPIAFYVVQLHFVGFAHTRLVGLLTRIMFGGFARQCRIHRNGSADTMSTVILILLSIPAGHGAYVATYAGMMTSKQCYTAGVLWKAKNPSDHEFYCLDAGAP
jgi:hypothetical protein